MWYVNECKQTLRRARGGKVYALNPFTPMNDQDRISPYNINRVSGSRQPSDENEEKYQLRNYQLIQYLILQTNIIGVICKQLGELLMRS